MDLESSHVSVIDGQMFYSPNCARDLVLPDGEDFRGTLKARGFTPKDMQKPRWWTPATEWLGFVPLTPVSFHGVLFDALSYVPRRMLKHNEVGYIMPQSLALRWLVIDELLSKVTKELGTECTLSYYRPYPPYFFNYHKGHPSELIARTQVFLGRDWFVVWIGLLYWMTCKIPDPNHREGLTPPRWFIHVVKMRLGQAIMDSIRTSSLLRKAWTINRVGLILPFPSNSTQPRASWFMDCGIPIWYRWGAKEADAHRRFPGFPLRAPSAWQLQEATTWISPTPPPTDPHTPPRAETGPPTISSWEPTATFLEPQLPHKAPHPSPEEVLQSFFAEREATNAKRKEKETPAQRQKCENRERQPPTTSAPVYIWDWDDDNPNLYRRRCVPVADRCSTLEDYGLHQRRYDSHFNEWDCSYEMGPDDDDDDDDDGNDRERAFDTPDAAEGSWNLPTGNLETAFLGNSTLAAPLAEATEDVTPRLLDILRFHFGFVPPLPIPEHVQLESSMAERKALMNLTGLTGIAVEDPFFSSPIPALCIIFLRHFWRVPHTKPSIDNWDIFSDNHATLSSPRLHAICTLSAADRGNFYMFDFGNASTVPWKLAVSSASVAISICRMDSELQERDIALRLLDEGISFRTLRRRKDLEDLPQEKPLPTYLPFRIATDQFSAVDFEYYKRQCDVFLKQRHARAALLRGGFLGRIARDIIRPGDALNGPTAQPDLMHCFSISSISGEEFIDDDLTTDEEDLLCGLYVVFTGSGEQQSKTSWFPLRATYEFSGMYQHRWTAQDEKFYIERIAGICGGSSQFKPLPMNKWRDKLRGYPEVRRAKKQLEEWSRDYLLEHR